jgi:hypothetical protein
MLYVCVLICCFSRPEYIEGVYKQEPLIANIYAHGTSVEALSRHPFIDL